MTMIHLVRTDFKNHDFAHLVSKLDADLGQRDGEDHAFYHQFNGIDSLHQTVVAYLDGVAVGCGALKEHDTDVMEVKRMYVPPQYRGKGIASKVLHELEKWAAELGNSACVLETGKRQPEAIALYTKNGYKSIPNYGPYTDVENSVCFKKNVSF